MISDAPGALALQDPSLSITAAELARRREAVEGIIEKMRDPRISDVKRKGKTVTMIGSVGSTDPKVARLSHKFSLERLGSLEDHEPSVGAQVVSTSEPAQAAAGQL